MNAKKNDSDSGFEKALERLEAIVAEMEAGELSLDTMIARFEEGGKLVKQCTAKLTEVEKKIEKLVSLHDPENTEPFETDEDRPE